jgi:hypothetical protein
MAVTGSGTQADPFVVHSYDEFISLSGHEPISGTGAVYIKWFDTPRQVLDCNSYGTEFKWGAFTDNASIAGTCTYYIDLNGATIKNFLIADGETMFQGHYYSVNGNKGTIVISNGYIRNVFMGSSTSKILAEYVETNGVSISANVAGTTVIPIGTTNQNAPNLKMDNSALYLVASTLNNHLMRQVDGTDTDIEIHVPNQNDINMFPYCSFKDCRMQGKVSGEVIQIDGALCPLGAIDSYNLSDLTNWVNCVIDVDFTDSYKNGAPSGSQYDVIHYYAAGLNTNVICKSHLPTDKGYVFPSNWNYLTHEEMRNGATLNAAGFTVVEVVDGD